MTESSINLRMGDTNNATLKETLCAQQRLLQKLYNELDVEREASATAASEALSMILRLQGEKAAVKMEAEQYKRLAEEKISHAEESMEIFEELICQKEMEIASLDYQVQAYRYKLMSLGCVDPGVGEIKFPENLLQRNETLVGETSAQNSISRRNSAPSKVLKLLKKGCAMEKDRSASPDIDLISKIMEESNNYEDEVCQSSDSEKKTDTSGAVDINTYWEQIRKLDEIVKEVGGEQYSNLRDRSGTSSGYSQVSNIKQGITNETDEAQPPANLAEKGMVSDSACSSSVHDVFEVPQTDKSLVCSEKLADKENEKPILLGNEKVTKSNAFPREAIKECPKGEKDLGKKTILSTLPSGGIGVDCRLAIVQPSRAVAEARAKLQHMSRATTENNEGEKQDLRERLTSKARGEEELKLLYEIREKLDLLQTEIRSEKTIKSSSQYSLQMISLTEEMLYFWL